MGVNARRFVETRFGIRLVVSEYAITGRVTQISSVTDGGGETADGARREGRVRRADSGCAVAIGGVGACCARRTERRVRKGVTEAAIAGIAVVPRVARGVGGAAEGGICL